MLYYTGEYQGGFPGVSIEIVSSKQSFTQCVAADLLANTKYINIHCYSGGSVGEPMIIDQDTGTLIE